MDFPRFESLAFNTVLTASFPAGQILVGDLVTPIMQHWFGTDSMLGNRTALTLIISVIFIIPLGSLPSVSMLQYSSFLTVISMIFMTIVIIVRSSQHVGDVVGTEESHHPVLWNWSWEALRALPIVWYNSGFIFQAIPVLSQNERQFTQKRTIGIMAVVTSIVAGLMLALGLPGYMTFYDRTNGNLLTNYAIDDPLIGVCRALVTVVVVCSYPLFNLPLRESVFYLLGQVKAFQERQSAASALALPATELSSVSSLGSLSSLSSSTDSDQSTKSSISGFASPTSQDELLHSEYETTSEDNVHLPHTDSMVDLDLDGPRIHEIPDDANGPITIPEAPPAPPQPDTQIEFQSQSLFAVYSRTVIQTIIAWALAFTLAYVIPDITIVISFVASTFSPIYYFCLPALVALSLPDKTNRTKMGAYMLFACCAIFLINGWGTYFLPKNVVSPALPSYNSTSTA